MKNTLPQHETSSQATPDRSGVGCFGVGCFGVGCFGVGCFGVGCFGVGCFGVGCCGVGCFGVGCFGVGVTGSQNTVARQWLQVSSSRGGIRVRPAAASISWCVLFTLFVCFTNLSTIQAGCGDYIWDSKHPAILQLVAGSHLYRVPSVESESSLGQIHSNVHEPAKTWSLNNRQAVGGNGRFAALGQLIGTEVYFEISGVLYRPFPMPCQGPNCNQAPNRFPSDLTATLVGEFESGTGVQATDCSDLLGWKEPESDDLSFELRGVELSKVDSQILKPPC